MSDNNLDGKSWAIVIAAIITAIVGPIIVWYVTSQQAQSKEQTFQATVSALQTQVISQQLSSQVTQPPAQATLSRQTSTGYIPTCNWEKDWALQPDGSYLWVGLPPDSPGCEMVGQAGELFQRLVRGENIKLVVNVGDSFVGLNICKGKFTATEVIPGETCVPMNPELWPKVKGTLIVTESDGFSVGKK